MTGDVSGWDVCWRENGPTIEPHFCREFTYDHNGEEVGCFGTDPDHGYTWEEARLVVARWHLNAANEWLHKPEPPK